LDLFQHSSWLAANGINLAARLNWVAKSQNRLRLFRDYFAIIPLSSPSLEPGHLIEFHAGENFMSEDKATAAKRTTKKAIAATAAAKPKKAAAAPKTKGTASKAATQTSKTVSTMEPGKPKKVVAAAKPKTVSKAPSATTAAAAKPAGEAKKKVPASKKPIAKPSAPSREERERWIATAAYHRAEKRGFATGYEMQDWLDAEEEINQLLGRA